MVLTTSSWPVDVMLVVVSLMVAAYLYMTRKFKYWAKRGVTEIPPKPFLGNFTECLLLKKSPSEFIQNLYFQSKGLPYMGFYIFDKPSFLARDPDLIRHILVKDFHVFGDRYATAKVTDRLGCANLFLMKNPGWKILRSKLTPIFTTGKLKKMLDLMFLIADDLDNHLEVRNLETPKEMEMKELCACFTTDMIGSTAFGLKVNSLQDPQAPFREIGREIFDYTSLTRAMEFLTIFFMPNLIEYTKVKFFGSKADKFLRTVFWEVINERTASGEKRYDLIDLLIELKEKHENDEDLRDFGFRGDDLVAQAAIFFNAGFETSSTTMCFTLYEVAMNMDIQRTLRKEILDALEETGGKITYEMLMTLPYLDMVVSETLRKYPPLAFLDRVCVTDYKIPNTDLVLEKGTPVYISMLGMHNDPQYFPEPDKYDPDRFSEENKQKRSHFTYFPFGEGPHNCIGLRLGLMQSKLGIVQVLRKYEVSPCNRTIYPMKVNPSGVTTTALGGLYLNVQKIV